jgi:pyruvate formate lyase activating enzyme
MREALLYKKGGEKCVHCLLCNHYCTIPNGGHGRCGVRENRDGVLYCLVYGKLVAKNIDPVEKKPLFHLLPGSLSYSIATVGCNFSCRHCQNASISQHAFETATVPGTLQSAEEVITAVLTSDSKSISYTYVEPTIFFEFAYDCMKLATAEGLKNIFVSNGFMSREATEALLPYLDAINIDLKAFTDSFYRSVCGARLQPVLDTIRRMHAADVLVEVTTLVIPGHNDSEDELRNIAEFLYTIDPAIPWHVSGFYPTYKMTDRPPTPVATLEKARNIGLATGLNYVYTGNRPEGGGENTSCPSCGIEVILRHGFSVSENRMKNGCCPSCGQVVHGVWK